MNRTLIALAFLASLAIADEPVARRPEWTASRVSGSPEPAPPYTVARAYTALKFDRLTGLERIPGTDRLLAVPLVEAIASFPDREDVAAADVFFDIRKAIPKHRRTYGVAFHPKYPQTPYVYICYVLGEGDPAGTKVSRFTVKPGAVPQVDPSSEKVLIAWLSGGHNGGCLRFGPDGLLYISTGDGANPSPPDPLQTGQDISDLLAAILRIDVDRTQGDLAYAVPADNPFVKTPGARPEIWAFGLRNPWKMEFDPACGDLWVGDVGWEMWEMVYRIERGGNYGWSAVEGRQAVKPEATRGPGTILPPTVDHPHREARSVTGGRVYHGKALADLAGEYVYGDYVTGKIWGLKAPGGKVQRHRHLADSPLDIIDFAFDSKDELLVCSHAGTIHRLVPNPQFGRPTTFPRTLSATGLFANTREQAPATGVFAYQVNAEPWADGETSQRWIAVPGTERLAIETGNNLQLGIVRGEFVFPAGTVIAKTLALPQAGSSRKLETQLLHRDGDTWRAYTYLWNDEQTDAELAPLEGADRVFTRPGADGKPQRYTRHFSARAECLVCHTTRAGSILGFTEPQLKRVAGPHELDRLTGAGLLTKSAGTRPAMPSPLDAGAALDARARSYLHVNCAHCHRQGGGGTAAFELQYELPPARLKLVGHKPAQGTFGIADAKVVAPGDPYSSVLYFRVAKLGRGRMPHMGSSAVDAAGVKLLHDWIASLPAAGPPDPSARELDTLLSAPDAAAPAIDRLLGSVPGTLRLLRALDDNRLPAASTKLAFDKGTAHGEPFVRDLFERFVPEEQRLQRLGPTVRPELILSLKGDPARGRAMFVEGKTAGCRTCHKVSGDGGEAGPDLTLVGRKLDRAAVLENLLEPSKIIEPKYVVHLARTHDGVLHSGIVASRSDKQVVLIDVQGKRITLAVEEIDAILPQHKSLMPEQLLKDLTAQQAADLVDFLAGLK